VLEFYYCNYVAVEDDREAVAEVAGVHRGGGSPFRNDAPWSFERGDIITRASVSGNESDVT
jgi:hypothetical protein